MDYEWDENKGISNYKKHGVTFEEAKTTWFDKRGIELFDPIHSRKEQFMKKEYDLKKMKIRSIGRHDPEVAKTPISIRMDTVVLIKLREAAYRAGVPYQTFISSVLFQYVSGELIEKKSEKARQEIREIVQATLEELEK